MQKVKMMDQVARHENAGDETAEHEIMLFKWQNVQFFN